ncbi:MAG: nicotinate (nicotinamide) nucleotide adenylyltransferase [Clostridiales bacterium]|nr:nicotinate (nicotinamide) nucleotide adenylyltransferase [Clostridiales bacterium]
MEPHIERIGIYGGTFSPIHIGHIRAANAFLTDMSLDKLYVIPAALPPHKAEVDGATANERLEMVRLAFADSDELMSGKLEVSDFEVKREGKSYTIYTLDHFTKPNRKLYLLVGTDMFITLSSWFQAERIFKLADIVLMRREKDDGLGLEIKRCRREYTERFGAKVHLIDEEPFEISSTELRNMLNSGESVNGLIPDKVIEYIKGNNLYR